MLLHLLLLLDGLLLAHAGQSRWAEYLQLLNNVREACNLTWTPRVPDKQPPIYRKLRMTEWSNVYGKSQRFGGGASFGDCPAQCEFVDGYRDNAVGSSADVVIVNTQAWEQPTWKRPPGQVWIGVYWESPDFWANADRSAALNDHSVRGRYNYTMGWSPQDDFFSLGMIYDTFRHYKFTRRIPVPSWSEKRQNAMMSVWISNCNPSTKTNRLGVLQDLEDHGISYASYGQCIHTGDAKRSGVPPGDWERFSRVGDGEALVAESVGHLFFYAAENSDYPWYHTEKVYHGLLASSVPVYLGPVTLPPLVPPNSVIYARDFQSSRHLAEHLLYLASNETAYMEKLAWRRFGLSPGLQAAMELQMRTGQEPELERCALCEFLHLQMF